MPELLPHWVYDLIHAVEKYEKEHARELHCFMNILGLIPDQERDRANVLAHYGAHLPQEVTNA